MKLCYVLPKFDVEAGEHVYHKYRFLSEIGKKCSLAVLVEKCRGAPKFQNVKEAMCVSEQEGISRFLETGGLLLKLSMQGYKKFFVHYSFVGAVVGSFIGHLTGAKTYYWNCGLPHLYFKSIGQKGWLRSKLHDDLPLRLSLAMADYVVTGTKCMKKYYHDEFDVPLRKILVIPNQVDTSRFNPGKQKNRVPVILFVHRISERKGAHYLVPIAKKVLKNTKAQFVIAGDGPYLPKLKESIRKNKLGRYVKTLGSVPNKEIPELYANSDVFLMPSDEEGFPNVLLEAMASGTPFVASDVGGVRDVISRSAQKFVVQKGDVDKFAEKILQLLDDSKLRAKLGKEGLNHVKQYNVSKVARLFVKTLKKH